MPAGRGFPRTLLVPHRQLPPGSRRSQVRHPTHSRPRRDLPRQLHRRKPRTLRAADHPRRRTPPRLRLRHDHTTPTPRRPNTARRHPKRIRVRRREGLLGHERRITQPHPLPPLKGPEPVLIDRGHVALHTIDDTITHVYKATRQYLITPPKHDAVYRSQPISLGLPVMCDLQGQSYTICLQLKASDHTPIPRSDAFTTSPTRPSSPPCSTNLPPAQPSSNIGIPLKSSPPTLEPWVATTADNHQPLPEAPRRLPETGALLCEPFQFPPALAQSIKLALQANGLQNTLFYTSERARGYDWYEQLPVITSVTLSPDHNPRNMTYRLRTLSLTIEAKTVSGKPRTTPHPPDPDALST